VVELVETTPSSVVEPPLAETSYAEAACRENVPHRWPSSISVVELVETTPSSVVEPPLTETSYAEAACRENFHRYRTLHVINVLLPRRPLWLCAPYTGPGSRYRPVIFGVWMTPVSGGRVSVASDWVICMASTREAPDLDTASGVLAAARNAHRAEADAQVNKIKATITWCAMHAVDSICEAATYTYRHCLGGEDTAIALAGPGAPLVSEFAVLELATALGLSTEAAKAYIGHALEIRYRLPRLWARVLAGQLPVWRARRVAEHTLSLPTAAAAFLDAHLAHVAHTCGPRQVEKLVEEALVRYAPDEAEAARLAAAEHRHFDIGHDQVSFAGTVRVDGQLDLADALDLDQAITAGAADLAALGSTQTLDVRRSIAAGHLARRQLALDLNPADTGAGKARVKTRQVVLHVHLTEDAITGGPARLGRFENRRCPISTNQVRAWCGNPHTEVTIKPVIAQRPHPPRGLRDPRPAQ